MYNKEVPIIIPTLNRVNHLKRCISSLQKNTQVNRVHLIIGVDFPPCADYVKENQEILKYVKGINGFTDVKIIVREKNYGVLGNYFDLVRYAASKYDYFIFSEDDVVYSPNFIEYMLNGIELLEKNRQILAVCAHSSGLYSEIDYNVISSRTFCAWGYAMKCSTFLGLLNNVISLDFAKDVISNYALSIKVWKNNPEAVLMLMSEIAKRDLYEDLSLSVYSYLFSDYYYVVPTISKAYNIGLDGSGAHSSVDVNYNVKLDPNIHFIFNLNLEIEDQTKKKCIFRLRISSLLKYTLFYFSSVLYHPSTLLNNFRNKVFYYKYRLCNELLA